MNDPWRSLADYESYDLVKRAYQRIHNHELSAASTKDITSLFSQFREYYRNADQAAFTVKPLLQYYGVLSAARALILMRSRGISLSSLKNGHGLDAGDWKGTIAKGLSHISELKVSIRNGTFLELLISTENSSPLRANSSKVNWKVEYDIPKENATLIFADLIRAFPDLQNEYKRWTGQNSPRATLQELKIDNEKKCICLKTSKALEVEVSRVLFPPSECGGLDVGTGPNFDIPDSFMPHFEQSSEGPFGIGDVEIVAPLEGGIHVNTIGKFFAASYILSMLVRYFPSTWISLGRSEPGDSIYPVVSRLVCLIQDKFPQVVLDYIEDVTQPINKKKT